MQSLNIQLLAKLDKFVLAVDGSSSVEGAIKASISLAKTFKSKVYLVSVVVELKLEEFLDTYPLEAALRLEEKFVEYLKSLKNRFTKEGIVCETILRKGPEPSRLIIEEAVKNDAELIVMGRRGISRFMRTLMGSVTAKTLGESPCSILVVPRDAEFHLNKILLATDGSTYSKVAGYAAVNLLKKIGGELLVVSVAKKEENVWAAKESVKSIKEIAEKEGIRVKDLVVIGEPFEKIVETADKENVGLIVMGCYGRTGIEKLLMGSVTERVIGFTNKPVLVVKKKF